MREQRLVFGEVAELYDKARAGYPDALVDDVVRLAGADGSPVRALEVGAGTGKATVSFAARGLQIVALEPSTAMAAVARRNCERFPAVSIEMTSFEDWPVETGGFGLLYSAQAWHWVTPEVRCSRAAEALRPGGTLALFWHRTSWQAAAPLRDELDRLYRRLVPDLYARQPGFPGLTIPDADRDPDREVRAAGLFRGESVRTYPWTATLTADSFIDLLQTQSDHRLLAEDERAALFGEVRDIIARHGGTVAVPHATLLVTAVRR